MNCLHRTSGMHCVMFEQCGRAHTDSNHTNMTTATFNIMMVKLNLEEWDAPSPPPPSKYPGRNPDPAW